MLLRLPTVGEGVSRASTTPAKTPNPALFNRYRVRRHHLNDGDVIVLGKHEIMYVDERSARGRHVHEPAHDPAATIAYDPPPAAGAGPGNGDSRASEDAA